LQALQFHGRDITSSQRSIITNMLKAQEHRRRLLNRAVRLLIICTYVLAFALLSLSAIGLAQSSSGQSTHGPSSDVHFTNGQSSTRIPFDFEANEIYLRVKVNNSAPLKFGFDTGAAFSIFSARKAAALGLKLQDDVNVRGIGGTARGGLAENISLQLPGVEIIHQRLVVVPFDFFPCDAQDVDGVIGFDLMKNFVVEIDYETKVVHLYDPSTYQYDGHGDSLPLTMKGTPRVQARVSLPGQAPIEGLFEIDTGSDGALTINLPFVKKHRLAQSARTTMAGSNTGVGGESKTIDMRLGRIELGRYVIANPLVSLSQDAEGALAVEDNDGPIGNEIFRRFKVTIDYSRQRMMLEPNTRLSDAFEHDMSGIVIDAEGKDCRVYKVAGVTDKSPAAAAGVKTGDEIIAIDGKPARLFTSSQLEKMLMQNGARHSLRLARAGQAIVVRIKLRRLI
jgi:hypothetical protein